MKRLIEKTNKHSFYENKGIYVPFKQGTVTEVILVRGASQTIGSYAWAAYKHGEMTAAGIGIKHDVPRVPLQFRLDTTGRQQLVAQIPEDVQYTLKPGELVLVYSTAFREQYKLPTAFAELRPDATPGEILRFLASMNQNTVSPYAQALDQLGRNESDFEILQKNNRDYLQKTTKPIEENDFRNESFLEDLQRKRRKELPIKSLESRLPLSVQGMQVLDESGDVRFQAVCSPGLEFSD